MVAKNPLLADGEGITGAMQKVVEATWSMPEKGKMINGRWFTQHALERMAPDTIQVRAVLESRAIKAGKLPGSKEFLDYVQPRGIPPSVVEDAIKNGNRLVGKNMGTLEFVGPDVTVVVGEKSGTIITIIPK